MESNPSDAPAAWLAPGQGWPAGLMRADAPAGPRMARLLVINLLFAMSDADADISTVAASADVEVGELRALLIGLIAPRIETVAALETALGNQLWPSPAQLRAMWSELER